MRDPIPLLLGISGDGEVRRTQLKFWLINYVENAEDSLWAVASIEQIVVPLSWNPSPVTRTSYHQSGR